MAKTRIYDLPKKYEGLDSKKIVSYLTEKGMDVKSQSSIDDDVVRDVLHHFNVSSANAEKPVTAPKTVTAEDKNAEDRQAENKKTEDRQAENKKTDRPVTNKKEDSAAGQKAEPEKPKKKKNITAVFNAQYSKDHSIRDDRKRPSRNGDDKHKPNDRKNHGDNNRNGFRQQGGHTPIKPRGIIRPRPEVVRPRPSENYKSEEAAAEETVKKTESTAAVQEKAVESTSNAAPQTAPKTAEAAANKEEKENKEPEIKRPIKRENIFDNMKKKAEEKAAGKSFSRDGRKGGESSRNNDGRNNDGRSSGLKNRNHKNDNNAASQSASENRPGRKDNRKKRNSDHDALGKKQEHYINLEKNGGKKKNKNNGPKTPQRDVNEILTITLPDHITIKDLADKMKISASDIIKKLFMAGKMVTLNSSVDYDEAEEIALEFNCICEHEEKVDVIAEILKDEDDKPEDMVPRPPVVCVMGHVDHGKTSLLDKIRNTHVAVRESGGITQKIGAYVVTINGRKITFLDTPGHEAFTAMRMRGANSTDIAILVVAADDGVMPQTVEAINHAKAAGVEIIVAVNKIDKPNANVERVKQELSEYELIPEDWGGSTIFVPVSAHTGEGIDQLLEMVLLTADVMELKADPKRNARGLCIEAELDKGRGVVATMLVQKGTLHVGDPVACGSSYGKVRAMLDENGKHVKKAGPSTPVEILGLSEVPNAGDIFNAYDSEREARNVAETFVSVGKDKLIEESRVKMSLDDLFSQIQAGSLKELDVIVKADVQGSVEALRSSLEKLSNDEVVVKVIHGGVGAITESDVNLAAASNAIIIGFNVRPDSVAKSSADHEDVDIRLYKVIYDAINDVEAAMKGMLEPIYEEQVIGHATIRQIFKSSDVGNIAGSFVDDGYLERDCQVRLFRGDDQIFEGKLASLKRFKDDVKEVKAGYECGAVIDGFSQFNVDDRIEAYKMVEVPRE